MRILELSTVKLPNALNLHLAKAKNWTNYYISSLLQIHRQGEKKCLLFLGYGVPHSVNSMWILNFVELCLQEN